MEVAIILAVVTATAIGCARAAWRQVKTVGQIGAEAPGLLSEAVADAADERGRMLAANEVLADIDHQLSPDRKWLAKLAWITFATGLVGAAAGGVVESGLAAGASVVVGLAGAMACVAASRALGPLIQTSRDEVDAHAARILGDLYDVEIVLPRRRQMRWQGSRGRGKQAGAG